MILPIPLPRGIHEIQPLKICVDFGHMFGTDPRKAALTLIWICHRRWDAWRWLCFLQWLGKVVMWGRSRPTLPCRSVQHAGQSVCGSKLGLDLAVFRLGGASSTSSPLLIYHFVANLGPSPVVRMMPVWPHRSAYSRICMHMAAYGRIWLHMDAYGYKAVSHRNSLCPQQG